MRRISCLSSLRTSIQEAVNKVREEPAAGKMWAWRFHGYGGLNELRLDESRVPLIRSPEDVLVRVNAASLNPIDIGILGGYGACVLNTLRTLEGSESVEFPLTCGRDFSGIVERAGPEARVSCGERVWGVVPPHRPGSHAQYVVVKNSWLCKAPEILDDKQAAAIPYAALTASAMLRVAGLPQTCSAGRRVLLLGLGGVGQAVLQLLVHRGAEVVVGCSSELFKHADSLGAIAAFDRHAPDYHRLLKEAGPYEVVLDCAGAGGSAASQLPCRFSRYVTLTSPLLRETDARGLALGSLVAAAQLFTQCAATARTSSGCPPPHVRWAYFMPCAEDLQHITRLAQDGHFTARVVQVFPWWEAPAAYEKQAEGHARGKIVIDFAASAH